MRLYFRYAAMHVRSAMQYRLDFLMMVGSQLLNTFFSFLSIVLLFDRFGTLLSFSFGEVALCFAVMNLSFASAECFVRGFDMFSSLIVRGDFDRLLVRPRTLALQVLGTDFGAFKGGTRFVYNLVVLIVAVLAIDTVWTIPRALTVAFMVIGGSCIMSGVFILGSTLCFFTIQGIEVVNIFTDGGREVASYPLTIYGTWIRRFFTFIIPFGLVNYLPLQFIAGQTANPAHMLMPLLGALFLLPALGAWYLGARRYVSTGS